MNYLDLSEIKSAELELLGEIAGFFDAHDIDYSLSFGTLLGAVRHKGFIPWDDDIDLFITREGYKKLLLVQAELPSHLFVVDWNTKGYPHHWAKICTKRYRAQEESVADDFEEYLWVDLFILDRIPKSGLPKFDTFLLKQVTRFIYAPYVQLDGLPGYKRALWGILRGISKRHSRFFHNAYERIITRYETSEQARYYTCFSTESSVMPKDQYDEKVWLPFEQGEFKAMSCYDLDLSMLFGDYMQLPPEDQRVAHNMKVWKV